MLYDSSYMKYTETESGSVVAWYWGRKKNGDLLLNGHRIFWTDENVLERNRSGGYNTENVLMTLTCTL